MPLEGARWPATVCCIGVVGCGGDPLAPADGGPISIGGDGAASATCQADLDCPFGEVCAGGACRPSDVTPTDDGCRSDLDCPAGLACAVSTGRCVDAPRFPDPPPVSTSSCAEGETRRCGTKVGACDYGVELCAGGVFGPCEGAIDPIDELCNGLDDDCDFEDDEAFVLGDPCSAGTGVCFEVGVVVCSADGLGTTCSVTGLDPTGLVELCGNQLDDDCDGMDDEGFTIGDPCMVGTGACERSGVTVCSADQLQIECSASAGPPATELCGNGADDDCDTETDEGFPNLGTACSAGVGACARAGTIVCSPDQLTTRCSASPAAPGPVELCGNTIDENCNGQTNEGFPNLGLSCTVGTPPCQATGTWVCNGAGTGLLCSLPPASLELCNGVDDDNDMCTDEDFNVGQSCTAGVGVCVRNGMFVCNGPGTATQCNATPGAAGTELCGNNLDDDCDATTDEGFPTLGNACTAGQGICRRTGAVVCTANRLGVTCDAVAGSPNAAGELCGNALDDDCDNSTDEGFNVGTACSVGQGICLRSGSRVCSADGLSTVCSVSPGAPNASGELCGNTLDDDCDGSTDEGFNVGTACTVGQGICQRSGTRVCSADRLSTVCSATPGAPNANGELCGNGQDDDCDGFTDEGYGNLGNACTVGVGACARNGSFVCSADRLSTVCNASAGTPVAESCNGVDDDCNGVVDNGCDDDNDDYCDASLTIVGTPAVCPNTVNAATRDCNDADATINPGAAEICNDARDQNCDGDPSDGCPVCNVAIDRDLDGSNECLDCDETNGAVRPGAAEACDGVDNDCDGSLDEGFDADGDTYTTCGTIPGGGTSPARIDCDDMNAARYPTACELCALGATNNTVACGAPNDRGNAVDEDCDGYSDETCSPCSTADPDGDGYSQCQGDCAPSNANVSPGRAETCDGLDTDCNTATTENCAVGDTCNWPGTPPPDGCQADLICVESLGGGGNPTGNFTCTSFCNMSPLGLGIGDGCAANQACNAVLTPTANLHGCAVTTDIGLGATGASCGADQDCRSSQCLRDQRVAGPPVRYCSDLCGNNGYCGGGTTCQVWGGDTARCWTTLSIQNRDIGVACNDTNTRCLAGPRTCIQIAAGNRICSRVCCKTSDCPNGYHCSPNGNDSAGPVGGYDTVPVCWPDGAGVHNRTAGQACTSSGQCDSQFCDQTLGVCVDLCCNDASCPTGLSCEQATIERPDGHQTIGRACVNLTPASPLEALP
jgi:hypothetical protein